MCVEYGLEHRCAARHTDIDHLEILEGGISTIACEGFAQGDPDLLAQLFTVVVDVAVFLLLAFRKDARWNAVVFAKLSAELIHVLRPELVCFFSHVSVWLCASRR